MGAARSSLCACFGGALGGDAGAERQARQSVYARGAKVGDARADAGRASSGNARGSADRQGSPPTAEDVGLLNGVLENMWPVLSKRVCNLLCDEVEPKLQQALGGSKLVAFDRSSGLGTFPLQFSSKQVGTREQSTDSGIITNLWIALDVDWRSNLSLGIEVAHAVGLRISSLSICGTLFVELVGMEPRGSVFQGVRVAFVNPPRVAFEFAGHGQTVLNSYKTTISSLVEGAVRQAVVLPNCVGTTFSSDADFFRVVQPRPLGMVKLRVIRAEGLPVADILTGSSDPYVEVRCGAEEHKSHTVNRCLAPTWSYNTSFLIWARERQKLYFDVWDEDTVGSDDLLGSVSVGVDQVCAEGGSEDGVELRLNPCGRIWVAAKWEDLLLQEHRDAGCTSTRGFLFVGVYSASDLPAMKAGTKWKVQASCSGTDLEGSRHETQASKEILPTVKFDGGVEESKASLAAAKELATKLALCASYSVDPKDAATLLDMDPERVEKLSAKLRGREPLLYSDVRAQTGATWNAGFRFLVDDYREAAVSFELTCHAPGGKPLSWPLPECAVADILRCSHGTDTRTLRLPDRFGPRLLVRMQWRHFGGSAGSPDPRRERRDAAAPLAPPDLEPLRPPAGAPGGARSPVAKVDSKPRSCGCLGPSRRRPQK